MTSLLTAVSPRQGLLLVDELNSYLSPDKGYFFSWRDPALRGVEEDWLSARNYCRQRCMDLVSLETSDENEWVKNRIVQDKVNEMCVGCELRL